MGYLVWPSGLLVVDLDEQPGIERWAELCEAEGFDFSCSLFAVTGGRGQHYYFVDDGRGRTTAGVIASNIDTRAKGGYVVAPPTMHASGNVYYWSGKMVRTLQPAPDWLYGLLSVPEPDPVSLRSLRLPEPRTDGTTKYGRVVFDAELARFAATPKGGRHHANVAAAVRAGQLYATGHVTMDAHDAVLAIALAVRGDKGDAKRSTRDGFGFGITHPRQADVEAYERVSMAERGAA